MEHSNSKHWNFYVSDNKRIKWVEIKWRISSKMQNKSIKIKNGNRGGGLKQTIKLIHWNAGNAWWEQKRDEIEAMLIEKQPDLAFITEANLRTGINDEQKDIQGYYMLTPNMHLNMGYSRILLLAREGVHLDIMNDCMGDDIPIIWVKITSRGRKPLVIGGVYREFHHLLQPAPNNTDEWTKQVDRWRRTVASWRKASKDTRTVLIGDLNIDYLRWQDPGYRLKKLVQIVKDEIVTIGFCQLVEKVTRSWPGQVSSILDHLWTNSPGNVISVTNTTRSTSDHNVISVILRTKDRKEHIHDTLKRNMKNFNLDRYREKISKINWDSLYESENIDTINDIFVDKVGKILEEEAPIKIYQNRKNFLDWLTPDLKNQMNERDKKKGPS